MITGNVKAVFNRVRLTTRKVVELEKNKTENDFIVDIILDLDAYTFSTVCAQLDSQQNDYVITTRDLCVLGGIGRTRIDRNSGRANSFPFRSFSYIVFCSWSAVHTCAQVCMCVYGCV
jgi:hypothetical protein